VDRIRRDGYAVSHDDVELGVKALSVPVHDHPGEVVAALGISGLTIHLPDTKDAASLDLLRTCVAQHHAPWAANLVSPLRNPGRTKSRCRPAAVWRNLRHAPDRMVLINLATAMARQSCSRAR
jgi:Bacterial transcriptional regulator